MKNICRSILGIGLALSIVSCETDLKVNADYSRTPIIYGVLDRGETNHMIRITKTFLGDGNAFDFAKVADSSKIQGLQAVVEALSNGNVVKTYALRDTVIQGKEGGDFYSGSQFMYYFAEPNLDPTRQYRISFVLDGKDVNSTTGIVPNYSFNAPIPTSALEMVDKDIRIEDPEKVTGSRTIELKLRTPSNDNQLGVETDYVATFFYTEVYADNSTAVKTISYRLAKQDDAGSGFKTYFNSTSFWGKIADEVKPNSNVVRRIPGNFQITAYTYTNELKTYIDVSNPVSGVATEKPEYSNINDGLGIFASSSQVKYSQPMSERSEAYLVYKFREDLKFCSMNYTDQRIKCQ